MSNEHFINLQGAKLNRHIYRIIPQRRFFELFRTHEQSLARPASWPDPFENFIRNSTAHYPDGRAMPLSCSAFFAQCWSLQKVSDALWQIYAPKRDGVRIRTTINRLVESLCTAVPPNARDRCFIGKVRYLSGAEIDAFARTAFKSGITHRSLAQTLLVKRPAFKHESEVRLLYSASSAEQAGERYHYEVNPHQLIDQIMVDPRLPIEQAEALIAQIRTETGYDNGKVKRSVVYDAPKPLVFPVGRQGPDVLLTASVAAAGE
jgi:hypothetical protein